MSYTALYRKFRPKTFGEVKGQDHIVTTLKNQIKAERIGHAYLFCGTRGTGKTSIAKILARAVNCENPQDGSPCGECESCRKILAGTSMNVIEIDAASNNGVDNVREIIDEVSYSPAEGKYKVYIIDEVHMLSPGAFNALLKTLEEPPSYAMFILATTEVQKLPITILSRCQRYDFKRISIEELTDRMKELIGVEQISVEDKALRFIAKTADGSMRDALSLLDQCIAFNYGEELTYDKVLDVLGAVDTEVFSRLLRGVIEGDVKKCVGILEEIVMQGREIGQFVVDFTWYLRNLLLVSSSDDMEDIIDVSSENLARLKEESGLVSMEGLMRYIRIFSDLSGQIRYSSQKRILVEIALIKLCKPSMEKDTESVLERVRILEDKVERGDFAIPEDVLKAVGNLQVGNITGAPAPAKRPEPPKALPKDIEVIAAKWSQVVSASAMPARSYLNSAVPSVGEDGRLIVELGGSMQTEYFMVESHVEELKNLIAELSGKSVEITVRQRKEGLRPGEDAYDIRNMINFDIETEEEV